MGCCFSRPSGPNSPYPGGAPNSSARHINPPPLSLAVDAAQPSSQQPNTNSQSRRRRRDQGPLDQHINKPLRRHEWTTKDRAWTRRELDRERAEFFDTRVTGRPEIWQTIHAALRVLWDPEGQDTQDDGANGVSTAQTILDAAEISLPTGDLANGVYDYWGSYYQLPEWIVADPTDLVEDVKGELSATTGEDPVNEDEGDEGSEEAERRREEKGKAVVDVREQISVRARLSETGRDYTLSAGKQDTVRSIARKIAEESNLPSTKKVRIAYMGKILKESLSLEAQGWENGHVVNALVFNRCQ